MSARRALVTGASRGIGAAVAVTLARDGCDVIVNYLKDEGAAAGVVARIEALGRKARLSRFDVTNQAETRAAIDALLEEGAVDIVVNNAGVSADAPFPSIASADWDRVLRTSLDVFYNVTQPLVMPMVRKR